MLIGSAPRFMWKIPGWQLAQTSHRVWATCGNTTRNAGWSSGTSSTLRLRGGRPEAFGSKAARGAMIHSAIAFAQSTAPVAVLGSAVETSSQVFSFSIGVGSADREAENLGRGFQGASQDSH